MSSGESPGLIDHFKLGFVLVFVLLVTNSGAILAIIGIIAALAWAIMNWRVALEMVIIALPYIGWTLAILAASVVVITGIGYLVNYLGRRHPEKVREYSETLVDPFGDHDA